MRTIIFWRSILGFPSLRNLQRGVMFNIGFRAKLRQRNE